jgi:hypothetical protein
VSGAAEAELLDRINQAQRALVALEMTLLGRKRYLDAVERRLTADAAEDPEMTAYLDDVEQRLGGAEP